MTNVTYFVNEVISFENDPYIQFVVNIVFIIIITLTVIVLYCWYESREEIEDGSKMLNPMKFSEKIKSFCCLPESCQASIAKCFILLGVVGSRLVYVVHENSCLSCMYLSPHVYNCFCSYLDILQEDEALRETKTLEKLMEARKLEKRRKKRAKKSSRSRDGGESEDDNSVSSGHGLL